MTTGETAESRSRSRVLGPLLVAAACLLWASDALVRLPATHSIDPVFMVFVEHLIPVLLMLPWLVIARPRGLLAFDKAGWASIAVVGVGGSAAATVLFTRSFLYLNPSVTILLQKLQPILVVAIARVWLGERPGPSFYRWAPVALLAAAVMSFSSLESIREIFTKGVDLHTVGVLSALGAATLWAISTAAGKSVLDTHSIGVTTFWRFGFALAGLWLYLAIGQAPIPWSVALSPAGFWPLLYLALVPGLAAIVVYYSGMVRTTASITTFAELTFPVAAVIVNTVFLNLPLSRVEAIAGAVLVFAVTRISR